MTSGATRIARVASLIARTSFPAISGAARIAHSEKCARYSASVIPPFPTSSMSGSFQWSGPANCARASCRSRMAITLPQRSAMSPDVRQRCPTLPAHSHGRLRPHSQIDSTIGRRVARIASDHVAYAVRASSPLEWHQSIFMKSTSHEAKRRASTNSRERLPGYPWHVRSPAQV